jgi:hypothetical protein
MTQEQRGRLEALSLGALVATGLAVDGPVPVERLGNESILRPLGAALVVLAALWFGALAASRVARAEP